VSDNPAGAGREPAGAATTPGPSTAREPAGAAATPGPSTASEPAGAAAGGGLPGTSDPAVGSADVIVRAAGGAVWRRAGNGELEVVLVHRARYDDWSLPKGKVDPGETDEQAALREVQEESSIEARLGPELLTTTYLDRSGKRKQVRYWAMTPAGGEAAGAHEVDEADWVPLREARLRLTYPRDVAVLDALAGATGGADRG
jgi:8-oxo-dGTP pyrophosphatase MutT (NUDIX family)